ncbi:MAG: response regulator [Pedobacter sp.]|nr:MAG: response regulator [Pedobacter sp.]
MNRRILLLEDDFDTNEIITMIFEPEGFEVLASSVGTYLHDIEKWNPELIIVDHLLNSATTGSDICIALKANAKTAHIPFILTSAVNNLPEVAEKCCPDEYIEKPFDIDNFVSIVRGVLSKRS